ncbi:MAG: phage holin family protein, partial [Bacteroidota bacterium]
RRFSVQNSMTQQQPARNFGSQIIAWLATAVGVYLASELVTGIHVINFGTAMMVGLVLGLLNLFVKPIMQLISIPLIVFTLGIFLIVINAVLLIFASELVSNFHVAGFWPAFWGAIIVSLVSYLINPPRRNPNGPGGGNGGIRITFNRGHGNDNPFQ